MVFVKLVMHVIEMSLPWLQLLMPQSWWSQSSSAFSLPSQSTLSSHIIPKPAPNVLPIASPDRLCQYRNLLSLTKAELIRAVFDGGSGGLTLLPQEVVDPQKVLQNLFGVRSTLTP